MKAWTKIDPKTGRFLRQQEYIEKQCKCGKNIVVATGRLKINRGKYCSRACMYKYRPKKQIKTNAKYSAIHKWMANKFGQSMECEWRGFQSDNNYQIQWANLSGSYTRKREDWARLCAKCHWHYDRGWIYAKQRTSG